MSSVTVINKDAVINISVSAGLVGRIQQIFTALVSERSKEELDTFKKLMSEKVTDFPEDWMENAVTLVYLLQTIESEAVSQGHTYQKEINLDTNTADS